MTTKLNQQVREFHVTFGQAIVDVPTVPNDDVVRLRARLVAEEAIEMLEAMFSKPNSFARIKREIFANIEATPVAVDLPELADALADLQYVIEGSAIAIGVDLQAVVNVVHASNMRKVGGPIINGKQRKPLGWVAPAIDEELVRQGWMR